MADLIVEFTDFSSDINLKSIGSFAIDSIVVKDAGAGELALEGRWGTSTLTDLVDDEVVALNVNKVLATGTSVAKIRVYYTRRGG
ncbi:MAG TPA: hypothetical protein VHB79_10375 [Polyangiaceae bacterium]|nr:hypothetical protein [Polyangiaceae bacterium]